MKVQRWLPISFAGALVVGVLAAAPVQATTSTATSKILAQATVAPTNILSSNRTVAGTPWLAALVTRGLTDGYVVDNQFQSGQSTGWHSHPGPSLVFVVSGAITNYESDAPGCAGVTYQAGSSFVDAGGTDVHMLRDDAAAPAETIAVQFIPSGLPRRIDKLVAPIGCPA